MPKIRITLPDGSSKEYEKGINGKKIAESIGPRLAKDAVAVEINGRIADLEEKINEDSKIRIITFRDKDGLDALRHSLAHLLAAAVMETYPGTKRTIGPPIENGFYYDFQFKNPITEEDLPKIEKKMREILPRWDKFAKKEVTVAEAKKEFKDNEFKKELIDEFSKKGEKLTFYKSGDYSDLCRGGHISSMKIVNLDSFKLTHIAGAYWRGNEKNPQLTRIYALAFPTKKELDAHLKMLEEAKKRDHRVLGKQLELFSIHEEGPGFIFFHPKGMKIINLLKDFSRKVHEKNGYEEIQTPIILNRSLWEQSGHWEHYKESMYFTKVDNRDFAVKPMNCPGSILVFKEKLYSYRDLPKRLMEYGLVHRHELAGVLSGLFRVRSFTQDDTHIFVNPAQMEDEIIKVIDLTDYFYKAFGFDYNVEISTRPEKFMGKIEEWSKAENALEDALKKRKLNYKLNPGDGAFYGPKIDFHIKDCIGRTWQCATIQVDFQMPQKFDVKYVEEDGKKYTPIIIHRVIYGSIERFFGILIEHYAGKFPLWLAPIQARILTVADRFNLYAKEIKEELEKNNLRVELDTRTESVEYKVRGAQLQKIPLILTVGEKEEKNETVAVRTLDNKVKFGVKANVLIKEVLDNIEKKKEKFEI
ncbi:threonine--tRNA ligase [Candidatus Woesearchaeota archaeon]|nr:threonine--tRNA ligase [Candidatus Woesearchaeota archaeon]